jgi:hypothetical protein
VYVVDAAHEVVDKFNAAGEFVCEITGQAVTAFSPLSKECANVNNKVSSGSPGGSLEGLRGIAVDAATGDVYVTEEGPEVVDVFGPEGVYLSQITGLSSPVAVAVSRTSGDVWIANSGESDVKVFDPHTKTLSMFAETTTFGGVAGVAVDNSSGASTGDVYVVNSETNVVDRFSPTGTLLGTITELPSSGPFEAVRSLAVDPVSGDVYVNVFINEGNAGVVGQFSDAGKFLGEIHTGTPASVAIAPTGDVYVAVGENKIVEVFGPGALVPNVKTGAATNVQGQTATVEGTVNPEGAALGECSFEYETSESGTLSAECEPSAANVPTANEEHTVKANLVGLESGATYHYRLHAANGNGVARYGNYEPFTTLLPPSIVSAVAKDVTPESALLEASIDPNGYPVTSCEFEYGATTKYGPPVACPQSLGEGTNPVTETLQLTGLKTGETYHWRIVAINANGAAKASSYDHTFVYDTTGGGLPDHRAYELVTPAHKNGALFGDLYDGGLPVEIANDGSRVIGDAIQCFGNAESCIADRYIIGTPYSFTRTSTGWQTTALAPPATRFPVYTPLKYDANTGDALLAFPNGGSSGEAFLLRGAEGVFTELGPSTGNFGASVHTEDFSNFAGTGITQVFEHAGADGSAPFLVGVNGGLGSTDPISACQTTLGGGSSGTEQGAMSADGSIVYFTALSCGGHPSVNELYARVDGEQEDAHTVPISVRSPSDCKGGCASSTPENAEFRGASEDGSKVFFISSQRLTDTAAQGDGNLYLYDFDRPEGERLIDVSAHSTGGDAGVQGVTAVSADGSHVYFVAGGVLTGEERPGCTAEWDAAGRVSESARNCHAAAGQDNLYVYNTETSRTSFVATLAGSDETEWGDSLNSSAHLANVTPDGRFLVFGSHARLTADATSRGGAKQVFRYDAGSGGASSLTRISIGNDGFNDNGNRSTPTPCNLGACTEDASIVQPLDRPRRDPTMSDNGEYVFFQSPVGLTPQALDDAPIGTESLSTPITVYAQNVYEWHQGHVYLISDGRDVSRDAGQDGSCGGGSAVSALSSVCLLGTDATGSDVFFSTADALVPQDTDTELDYYDARIDGGFPAPAASPPCLGEVCHGIPAGVPGVPAYPSQTFNGQGNLVQPPAKPAAKPTAAQLRAKHLKAALKACHRDKKRSKRVSCERAAHRKFGPVKRRK